MAQLEQLNEQDAEEILRAIAGVCNGLPIGKFTELVRESANRSGFTKQQVEFAIALIALHWGRVKLECFELEFSNRLHVVNPKAGSASVVVLHQFGFYVRLKENAKMIERKWLNKMASTYSTEYKEIMESMPTTVDFHGPDPSIVINDSA